MWEGCSRNGGDAGPEVLGQEMTGMGAVLGEKRRTM